MICPKCLNPCIKTDWKPSRGLNPELRQHRCPNCGDEYYAESSAQDEKPAATIKRARDPGSRPMTPGQTSSLFLSKG